MNPEMYVFTIVVALIGMVTVFTSLTLLSLMMMGLRRIFPSAAVTDSIKPQPPVAATYEPTDVDQRWVVVGAAAFLALEQESGRSAEAWKPASDDRIDPWINQSCS